MVTQPALARSAKANPRSTSLVNTARDTPLGELGRHPRLDQERLAGRAVRAGAQVGGLERGVGGEVQIGIVEDHHRAVAAELEQLGLPGCPRCYLAACLDRADEPDAG